MPAEPLDDASFMDHCRALERVTGAGRDGEVAVIKMAAQGFACQKLRDVLLALQSLGPGEMDTDDADELVEYVMSSSPFSVFSEYLTRQAELAGRPREYRTRAMLEAPEEPGLADVRARAAFLSLALAATGEDYGPDDFAELDNLLDGPVERMAGTAMPEDLDRSYLETISGWMPRIIEIARSARERLEQATTAELVANVKSGVSFVNALTGLEVQTPGDEAYWRMIGTVAPIAESILQPLRAALQVLFNPGHERIEFTPPERAYLEAILDRPLYGESKIRSRSGDGDSRIDIGNG